MDSNMANIVRKIIRILSCVFAVVAGVTAFIFRNITSIDLEDIPKISSLCMVSRIFAILMFVCAVGLLVIDLVTKEFPISVSAIGLVIALIGFIGNFIIAVASTKAGFLGYIAKHVNIFSGKLDATQLNIGAYMILASAVFSISYHAKCMKSGQ